MIETAGLNLRGPNPERFLVWLLERAELHNASPYANLLVYLYSKSPISPEPPPSLGSAFGIQPPAASMAAFGSHSKVPSMEDELHRSHALMMEELERDERFLPSAFWRDISQKNMAMLEADGLENFKRTVSQNYYNWVIGSETEMYKRVYRDWCEHRTLRPWFTRNEKNIRLRFTTGSEPVQLTAKQAEDYRLYVTYVWDLMRRADKAKLRNKVSEPETGNPIRIRSGTKLISQDLANSIIEANVVAELLQQAGDKPRIAEIGAGSGRLAHVCASTLKGSYFIFDIPPALYVSQWYLTRVMPQKRIFSFRSFDDFADIEKELERADIAFFTANQLDKFPPNYFDVILSISTLPEMRPDQVSLYFSLFQSLSRRHIYLKQWKSWKNPLDGTDIQVENYLLGSDWQIIMDRTDPIVPEFFNRVWRRN